MIDFIATFPLFQDKLDADDRSPIATFHLPTLLGERKYGILIPKSTFQVQVTILVVFQVIACAIFAALVYNLIILPKRQNSYLSSGVYLIGFGVIIPAASIMPFLIMEELDIRNKMLRTALVAPCINVIFRCLEAMFGFTPPAPGASLKNYCLYYASLTEPYYDPKTLEPVPSTKKDVLDSIIEFLKSFVGWSILLSLLAPYGFELCETSVKAHTLDHGIMDLLELGHVVNNLLAVFLIGANLEYSSRCVSLIANTLLGIKCMKIMEPNAIFGSTSPSDFWGRRWNLVVHNEIKRGIYLPARRYFPKTVAAMATFFASGLMHEFMNAVLFYTHDSERNSNGICNDKYNDNDNYHNYHFHHSCFYPIYGKNMILFSWCGFIVLIEQLYGGDDKCRVFRWINNCVPQIVITALLIMTVLPMCHLLSGDWVVGGFFAHMAPGFVTIVPL